MANTKQVTATYLSKVTDAPAGSRAHYTQSANVKFRGRGSFNAPEAVLTVDYMRRSSGTFAVRVLGQDQGVSKATIEALRAEVEGGWLNTAIEPVGRTKSSEAAADFGSAGPGVTCAFFCAADLFEAQRLVAGLISIGWLDAVRA